MFYFQKSTYFWTEPTYFKLSPPVEWSCCRDWVSSSSDSLFVSCVWAFFPFCSEINTVDSQMSVKVMRNMHEHTQARSYKSIPTIKAWSVSTCYTWVTLIISEPHSQTHSEPPLMDWISHLPVRTSGDSDEPAYPGETNSWNFLCQTVFASPLV